MLKTEPMNVFSYQDLEEAVKDIYGIEIDILNDMIPDELVGHYTYHEFTINGESELDCVGDDVIVAKWIETGETKSIDMSDVPEFDWRDDADLEVKHVLHRMYKEGHIPAGKYLMQVDW